MMSVISEIDSSSSSQSSSPSSSESPPRRPPSICIPSHLLPSSIEVDEEEIEEEIEQEIEQEIEKETKDEVNEIKESNKFQIEITVDTWQNAWFDPHFLFSLIINGTGYQFRFSKLKTIVGELGIDGNFPPGHFLPFLTKRFDSEQDASARAKQLQSFMNSLTCEQFNNIVSQLNV